MTDEETDLITSGNGFVCSDPIKSADEITKLENLSQALSGTMNRIFIEGKTIEEVRAWSHAVLISTGEGEWLPQP